MKVTGVHSYYFTYLEEQIIVEVSLVSSGKVDEISFPESNVGHTAGAEVHHPGVLSVQIGIFLAFKQFRPHVLQGQA